jgi:hypothetical protein
LLSQVLSESQVLCALLATFLSEVEWGRALTSGNTLCG